MEFAIVDIETTGGSATYHKIVEIAIIIHNGYEVIDSFQTLINPERYIPANVSLIHGITNEMVEQAPKFFEVAKKIFQMTENRIFVAHSVNFDYSFIKKEFEALGGSFPRKKLCTVRLSKQLIPGHRSYSLGNICGNLGISISDRHRAFGDAEATAKLFTKLVEKDAGFSVIKAFLNRKSKQTSLPPHLEKSSFDRLPSQTGVYYFHDDHGNVIYVGKALNIKERVAEHFSGNTHTKTRQMFLPNIKDVTYEVTGNEFLALLLENESIKKHFPRYNRTNKTFDLNHGIYTYEDQNGYMRALIGKAGKRDKPVTTFKTVSQATTAMLKLSMQHRLCLRLNGLLGSHESKCEYGHSKDEKCLACGPQSDIVKYNRNFQLAMNDLLGNKSYIIKTNGRKMDEEGFVYVEKGKFLGFGYVSRDEQITSPEELKGYLKGCYDTQDSQTIIHSFLKKSVLVTSEPMPVYRLY